MYLPTNYFFFFFSSLDDDKSRVITLRGEDLTLVLLINDNKLCYQTTRFLPQIIPRVATRKRDTERSGYGGVGFVSVCLNGSVVAGRVEIEKENGWLRAWWHQGSRASLRVI